MIDKTKYTPKQYRYWFMDKTNCNLILTYSKEELEDGEYKKDKLKWEEKGYRLKNKSEFVGVFYNRELYDGDLVLVITSSDVGIRRYIKPLQKDFKINKNIGGTGGNAYVIIKDIIPIDDTPEMLINNMKLKLKEMGI